MSSALFTFLLLAALPPPPCLLTGLDEGLLVDELPELKLGMKVGVDLSAVVFPTCKHGADYVWLSTLCPASC